ncbi:tyrosine phosphatase family protein [Lutibaculum baratangense]|uniref:Tyrosine specific protein phosphatases domain-containing protein n=1 Tax=Lutibaculum baratangense AMV1 TaxID=631454 RepID=V4RHD1_9HYPH|nr:tyrosine phosphatase family protein [Lutibaculum baratangense]ESR24764.1 hypothetical protein N177_2087 [Lutibaculum baratangense AMV1]
MPEIHVCSLARLPQVTTACGASHVVTLINAETPVPRPESVVEGNHLFLGMNDIVSALEGQVMPGEAHVRDLVEFARRWDRERPCVVHCWAGISRSTAAAFIMACAIRPDFDEAELARDIRFNSPTATPNRRLVELGDQTLGRNGRMVAAVEAIGRGAFAHEGIPFSIPVGRRG